MCAIVDLPTKAVEARERLTEALLAKVTLELGLEG